MTCIPHQTNGFYLQGNNKDNRKPNEILTSFVVYFIKLIIRYEQRV